MSTPDELRILDLRAFAAAYRTAETRGTPVSAVSHAGWHPGARVGAGAAHGRLLAFHDDGDEAECVFRAGRQTLFTIMRGGNRRPGEKRPFSLWGVAPGICGTLAPEVVGVEVVAADGSATAADVVAHTFAADIDVVPPLAELPDAASIGEKLDAVWAHSRRAYAEARRLRVRVCGAAGALLYEGPLILDD